MKTLLLTFSLFFFSFASAQPVWDWARTGGGNHPDAAISVCTTPDGYAYTTGVVSGNVTFAPFTLTGPVANYEMFIAKYAPWGDCLWAIRCPYAFVGWSIAVDATGDVYVWAETASGFSILKYDASGNLLWTRVVGGHYVSTDMAVNAAGTILVAGTAAYGGIVFGQDTVRQNHTFVARYDSSGAMTDLQEIGRSGRFQCESLVQDNAGAVFLTGSLYAADTIGQFEFPLSYTEASNLCLIKLDAQLTPEWVVSSEGPGYGKAVNICADQMGGCYVTGSFDCGVMHAPYEVFFGDTFFVDTISYLYTRCVLAHIDMNGNRDWVLHSSSGAQLELEAVATDGQLVFFAGSTSSDSLTFGSAGFALGNQFSLKFLFSVDADGSNATTTMVSEAASITAIQADTAGGIYMAGWHGYFPVAFGNEILPADLGGGDMFIAKLRTGPAGIQNTEQHSDVQMLFQEEDVWQLQLGEAQTPGQSSVLDIYDMNGQLVKQVAIVNSRTAIDCSNLAAGMYAWHLHGNSATLASGKISVW